MKKYYVLLLVCLVTVNVMAQKKKSLKNGINIRINDPGASEIINTYKYPSKEVFEAIKKIILEEKIALKKKIESIEMNVTSKKISKNQAEKLKTDVANNSAKNIENRIALEELKLKKILQEYTDHQIVKISVDSVNVETKYGNSKRVSKYKMTTERFNRHENFIRENNKKRFFEQGVIAFGLNNVIVDGKLSSDFKTWSSRFYEFGYTFKSRLSKDLSPFYLKYGASLLINNLQTNKDQYFVKNGDKTNLAVFSNNLESARLKNIQLIFPVHFEVDFSKPDMVNGLKSSRTERFFRFGLGGYGGFRLHSRQILKYRENGVSIKNKATDNFNLNNFTYGVSGYFGYRSISLYGKYDINTLFKNNDGRTVSLGLRLEI